MPPACCGHFAVPLAARQCTTAQLRIIRQMIEGVMVRTTYQSNGKGIHHKGHEGSGRKQEKPCDQVKE
jgi:hypothetical protein